jgi:hypothetical protein
MPDAISYAAAFNFAVCCTVGKEFLAAYGSEIQWQDCPVDIGELMAFIEEVLDARLDAR